MILMTMFEAAVLSGNAGMSVELATIVIKTWVVITSICGVYLIWSLMRAGKQNDVHDDIQD